MPPMFRDNPASNNERDQDVLLKSVREKISSKTFSSEEEKEAFLKNELEATILAVMAEQDIERKYGTGIAIAMKNYVKSSITGTYNLFGPKEKSPPQKQSPKVDSKIGVINYTPEELKEIRKKRWDLRAEDEEK